MREYNQILQSLSTELNHKGRSKKGYDRQEEILNLLRELKTSYGIELSTYFLRGLLNDDLTNRQKTQKIADLIRGLEKETQEKYFKEDELVKYRKEILEYGYKKGFEPYKPILKSVVVKIGILENPLFNAEIDTGRKELIGYNVVVKEFRSVTIGRDFRKTTKRKYCFLGV